MNLRTTGYRIKKAVALALMTTLLFFVLDGNIHPNKPSHNAYAQTSTPTCQKLPIATVAARSNSASASNVLDNNLNTAWIVRGMGQWIQADLGSNMNICDVNIAWYRGNMAKSNFIISVSADGSTFTNVFTGISSGSTLSFEKYTVSGGTTGRYVRITVNGNNFHNRAGLTELSIDGSSNPTANNENIQTNSGAPVQITLTGTDPIAGDLLTFTVVTPPKNGTLTPGTVSSIVYYTPNIGFSGTDSFTYKATDGQGEDSNIATVTITVNAAGPPPVSGCTTTTGWYITGYINTNQADYPTTPATTIMVGGQMYSFNTQFLIDTQRNGYGLTNYGWYLSNDGSEWVSTPNAYDAQGNPLVVGKTIAVDTNLIPFGTTVTIPTLPAPWNSYHYVASDVGPAINQKHIDVFTGTGQAAAAQANAITGYNNSVCK
jgi:3D (Asp-Asp-Asp) domain-containing protein